MSFLGPILATLGGTFLPKVASWIGKKINGSPLGQVASHVMDNN